METETKTQTGVVPFASLTLTQLNHRAALAREACGYRCVSVVRAGDDFTARDLAYLRQHAALSETYHQAAMARIQAGS